MEKFKLGLIIAWLFPTLIAVTSQWAPWRLTSLAYRLFTQPKFRHIPKKTSKLRVTGLCEGNTGVMDSPHKRPATRKMIPFDDVIMWLCKALSSNANIFGSEGSINWNGQNYKRIEARKMATILLFQIEFPEWKSCNFIQISQQIVL